MACIQNCRRLKKKATFLECTRWTKFGCWSSMSGCFSSPVWALPRESLTNISFRGNSLWRWQHDFALPHWLDVTRWILTCLCWTSSGHRKLAATYLLSLCIYLRSCCLTWKSLHIALYSMFWAWQLYLWICFTGKQWMPLIQKTFQSYIGRVRTVKKGCFTWDFTCDMFHVELHYFRIYLWYNDSKTWFSLVFCCTIWNLLVKVLKIPLESSCGDAALL